MRALSALAVLILLSGCDPTAPELVVPGNYTIRTVEGRTLPAPAIGGYVVVGGLLTLSEDGLYRDSVAVRATDGSWTSFHLDDGVYTLNGGNLVLEHPWNGSPACDGRINHSGYTCASPHGRLVWVRM